MLRRCFQQWSVEHSHTHRPGSGRPCSTEARQDRRILGAAVTASREEMQAHVAPAVSPNTIAVGLRSRVPLARLPLTPRHRQARLLYSGLVKESTRKWNGAMLFSVMRVGFVCMRVMDEIKYVNLR